MDRIKELEDLLHIDPNNEEYLKEIEELRQPQGLLYTIEDEEDAAIQSKK